MKKFAKKALSLLLAVLMMFSLASFAFAENSFTIDSTSSNVETTDHVNFTAYYTPNYNTARFTVTDPATPKTAAATWSTNRPEYVAFDASGKASENVLMENDVYLRSNGTANITVSDAFISTKSATFSVTAVADAVQSVTIDQSPSVSVGYGQTATLSAKVAYAHCPVETSATWTSANPTIASVDPNTGVVTGKKVGTTKITAASGGVTSHEVDVNVMPTAGISPDSADVDEGTTTALTMTASGLDIGTTYTYVWSSNNPAVPITGSSSTATVDTTDISDKQTATITCIIKSGGTEVIRDTSTVNAYPKADSVIIKDGTTNVTGTTVPMTSTTKTLTCSPNPSTARGQAKWESSDTTVAAVGADSGLVASTGKNGTAVITCTFTNKDRTAMTAQCTVSVSTQTKSAYDVPMSATNRINTTMSAAYTGIRNAYNSTYYAYPNDPAATITFSSIPRTCGTLYTSAGYTSPAAEKTAYSFSSLSSMSYSPSTVGTEILTYTLANGTNYLTGRIVITVNAPGSTVVVNLDGSDPYTFSYATSRDGRSADASIYNTIFSATGKTYSYLIFDPVSSAVGTLYGSSSGTAVTANTPYYYSGAISTNTVSRLYFVPSNTGTYARSFRAYLSDGTQIFSGTLQLVVPSKPADAAVSYSTPISSTLAMNETDFVRWYESQTSSSYFLSSVTFNSVQYSNSAYPGYFQHASSTFAPGNGVSYYTSTYNGTANYAGNYLSKVTYHSPSVTCWLRVDFTCCGGAYRDSLNLRKSGTMYICVTRNAVPDIRYTVSRGTSKALAAADFVNAYKTAMNVSSVGSFYVQFLNVPSMGSLSVGYVNAYYPGTTLNAANVNSSNFYVNYTGSAYSISNVSYVPGYYQSNTDTVKYAAYSLNSQLLYIGEIGFLYGTGTGSDCYSDGYSFSSASFYSASDADPVYSVTFSQPATGTLYYNYAHGIGTAVTNSVKFYTKYSGYGTLPVSSVVYIPRMSYSGTVSIPYTTTTASGRTTSASLVLSVGSKTASSLFYDVTPANTGSWSANSVDFACKWGLISGTGTYTFSPNTYMSRGMLATVLYSAAGKPNTSGTLPFTDVKYTDYYCSAILWAYNNGVVSGKTATAFAPGANVTREQFAAILYAFASRAGRDMSTGGSLYGYSDAGSVSGYARTAMQWAVYHGYISGTGNNRLNPKGYATRAQAVVMLHSYLAK